MTWYLGLQGKPAAVARKVAEHVEREAEHASHTEQGVMRSVGDIVSDVLRAYPPDLPVKVEGSGSQNDPFHATERAGKHLVNQISLKIEPMYGFLEDEVEASATPRDLVEAAGRGLAQV